MACTKQTERKMPQQYPRAVSDNLHLEHPHPGLVMHPKRLVRIEIQQIHKRKEACRIFAVSNSNLVLLM